MNDLKKLVHDITNGQAPVAHAADNHFASSFLSHNDTIITAPVANADFHSDKILRETKTYNNSIDEEDDFQDAEEYHELESTPKPLSLEDMERQMIKQTLEKHRGKRKAAADELKISERTLYRKIKEYGIE